MANITGTANNDILNGTAGDDLIEGLAGADVLYGLAGNDTLDGGPGADKMYGGAGNDTYVIDNAGDAAVEASISLVSTAADGGGANEISAGQVISADGRYVAFLSHATNLVAGGTNGNYHVFVKDLQTGATKLVSTAADGTQGNDGSYVGSISADGRYVAFTSYATNLVAGDTNGVTDAFVKDLQTGTIARVSTAADGTQGSGGSGSSSISADGRYVTFESYASNLVVTDTNGWPDIFVKDLQTGAITRVSTAADGTQGNDWSFGGSALSADGRYVAFHSGASNLVSGDTNGSQDVFAKDLHTGAITRVSTAADGTQGNGESATSPSISADGRYVAFESDATNLVTGDTNGNLDVFVKDLQTGAITRASTAADGTQVDADPYTPYPSYGPQISADGRYVAFHSAASNLVAGDTGIWDVFVKDLRTGAITRVSTAEDGTQANDASSYASISADGRLVAFNSEAGNLVVGPRSNINDVYVASVAFGGGGAGGTDSVSSSISYSLGPKLENLTLTDSAAVNGTGNDLANALVGNDANNILAGLAGNDTLSGGGGNDTLDGGTGADAMAGGAGNDIYLVDDAADAVTEASGAGTDEVRSILSYTLGVNLENLTLVGTVALSGSGNELANVLIGNAGNNALTGGAGNDTLDGGGGGFDRAIFTGAVSSYHFAENGAQVSVSGPDGIDTLTGIEQLNFGNLAFSIADRSHFDPLFYLNQNPDVAAAAVDPLTHYRSAGWAEGRDPSASVDLAAVDGLEYIASYGDLAAAFGLNKAAGYQHFATTGLFEGRTISFDGLEYIASYGDLMNAFGANTDAGASHYIQAGRFEARHISFDALEYIASYEDLIKAFGANGDAGASHYIGPGHTEGRHVTFDGLQYIASYDDLIIAFHTQVTATADPDIGANHYIVAGYGENRHADQFDAAQYLANYADLQAAFGHNTEAATLHFITAGYFEGRTDDHLL